MRAEFTGTRTGLRRIENVANPAWLDEANPAIKSSPGLQDLWQLHFSNEGGKDHNAAESFIANPSGKNDGGFVIEAAARPDGTLTVRNDRNGFEKTYRK